MNIPTHAQTILVRFSDKLRIPTISRHIVERLVEGEHSNAADRAIGSQDNHECLGLRPNVVDVDMRIPEKLIIFVGGVEDHDLRLDLLVGDGCNLRSVLLAKDHGSAVDPTGGRERLGQGFLLTREHLCRNHSGGSQAEGRDGGENQYSDANFESIR